MTQSHPWIARQRQAWISLDRGYDMEVRLPDMGFTSAALTVDVHLVVLLLYPLFLSSS